MATLDDILTTQKNGVIAINNLNQTNSYLNGKITSATVSALTLIYPGAGRLVNFSIVVAGSANGTINNAQTTGTISASNALVATPNVIGVYACGIHFSNGLVIDPGTGQSVNVTYSVDA